jgi:hypothetical protein
LGAAFAGATLLERAALTETRARAQSKAPLPKLFEIEKVAQNVYAAIANGRALINCNAAIFERERDLLIVDAHSQPSAVLCLGGADPARGHRKASALCSSGAPALRSYARTAGVSEDCPQRIVGSHVGAGTGPEVRPIAVEHHFHFAFRARKAGIRARGDAAHAVSAVRQIALVQIELVSGMRLASENLIKLDRAALASLQLLGGGTRRRVASRAAERSAVPQPQ